jgi:riboflavin kinase/FMN adenylyltransferase
VVVVEQECVADTIISSTLIRNKMLTDNIEEINKLLGYEYSISGIVMLGNQLGRTIGFPTANISISENKLLPKKGVYLCDVNVKNKQFTGLANIGTKPTIDSYDQPKISLEVHILDFLDDIYGEKISINLKKYIREERKFNALQELKEQIRLDIQSIQLSSVSSMLHQ